MHLKQYNIPIDTKDSIGETFYNCIEAIHSNESIALIKAGFDPNKLDDYSIKKCYNHIDELLKAGLDPDKIIFESSLLSYFTFNGSNFTDKCLEPLLAAGANPNHPEAKFNSPLQNCIKNAKHIKMLLDAGADPNTPIPIKSIVNVLYYACLIHTIDDTIITLLLDYGANPYACNAHGTTIRTLVRDDPKTHKIIYDRAVLPKLCLIKLGHRDPNSFLFRLPKDIIDVICRLL